MAARAKDGATLEQLVKLAMPFCRQAEQESPRVGPGRKPDVPDWVLAVMIMVAVMHRKKTKSAQHVFWHARREQFAGWFAEYRLLSRSQFFDRYRRVHRLFQAAIRLQGQDAIRRGWANAQTVAIDKSLVEGQGRPWGSRDRRRQHVPRGVDRDTTWGYSEHDGWVQGYSYEVVGTADKDSVEWPLLASADTASCSEQKSALEKMSQLPGSTKFALADAGYDSNAVGESVEWTGEGLPTGRRFLCPEIPRPNTGRPRKPGSREGHERQHHRRLRERRRKFFQSPRGQKLYARRKTTIEPFHSRFKHLFELHDRAWHRGLQNNRTMLLAAIFAYQTLLTHNHRHQRRNACVQKILDSL